MARQETTGIRHSIRSLIAVVTLLAGVLLGGAAPASVHATLTGSDPVKAVC
ncbi:hypothetical protein AB0F77_38915 [Streptomyces sp. NPDC026672]|uniref:hypothetical protein n=1 Tax=unclassified Streptomyces TaxID=2593676 RepID=UPI0033EF747B